MSDVFLNLGVVQQLRPHLELLELFLGRFSADVALQFDDAPHRLLVLLPCDVSPDCRLDHNRPRLLVNLVESAPTEHTSGVGLKKTEENSSTFNSVL